MIGMLLRFGLGLLVAGLAHAQIANLAIEDYTLPNGMEVLLHVDRKAPLVHLNFRYRVGAKHEKAGHTGLAHLVEHLLFQVPEEPGDFAVLAERLGAAGVNGSAAYDYTEFYATVPTSRLERMLWRESNLFTQFEANLTQENLDRQRAVVINEKRQRTENVAYGRVDELMHQNVFPSGHPYQHETGGAYADLRATTLDDVRAFYDEHYTPDQMTLAIVGDFDPAQAKQWVAKYFGSMAPGSGLASPVRWTPRLDAPRVVDLEDRVRVPRVYFYWPAPPMAHRDEAALEFACFLLTDESGPRHLQPALTEKLSLGVSTEQTEYLDASLFSVSVSLAPGASRAAVEEKIASQMARLAREGPSAAEMERTRNNLEFARAGELETLAGLANALQRVRHFYGGIDRWGEWAARYTAVTADDVRSAVGRWLTTPNHLAIDVRPHTALRDATPEPDREKAPPIQPEKAYRAPELQSAKLPNGVEVLVMERHEALKIAVQLQLRVGSLHNPSGKQGLAALTAATAGKGTTNRKEDDINREKANLAMELFGSADLNTQAAGFEAPRKNLEPAFRLFADVVLNANYPDWAVEAQKKDWLDELEKPQASEIGDFARPVLEAAFGTGHPLGATGLGSRADLRSLTPQDVRDFHARYWRPDISALVFAGDITLKEAVALATESLGNWSGTAGRASAMPPPQPKQGRAFLVDRKGATQTMVVLVAPGIPRDSPDYPALLLANQLLGGISASRLNQNIRQEKGIAYYAASQLWHYPGLGLWVAWSQVQTDRTAVAMSEFQKELRGLAGEKPITPLELEEAKSNIIRGLPAVFETVRSAAGEIAQTWAVGLPVTDFRTLPERIAATSLAEVTAAARKYATGRTFFVLLGDREKIEGQVRELGLGQVQVVE
jgi:zinc protease